jgi:chaperone BCS1
MGYPPYGMKGPNGGRDKTSNVTLSGLLNVLDGVGSDEGKLFFATTNYIDHLDSALIRPGRIDVKIEYKLAIKQQATALFKRFYPTKHFNLSTLYPEDKEKVNMEATVEERMAELAESFSDRVPENEFSTAELQGYLLGFKMDPLKAVDGVASWVQREHVRRAEKEQREAERKAKANRANQAPEGSKFPFAQGMSLSGMPGLPNPETFEVVAATPPGDLDADITEGQTE